MGGPNVSKSQQKGDRVGKTCSRNERDGKKGFLERIKKNWPQTWEMKISRRNVVGANKARQKR